MREDHECARAISGVRTVSEGYECVRGVRGMRAVWGVRTMNA